MVGQDGSFKPVIAAAEVEFAYQSLLHKNPEVPIHRAQTQVWELPSDLVEHPLRRGVVLCFPKNFQDSIALLALSGSSCHTPPASPGTYLIGIITDYNTRSVVVK